MDPPYNPKYPQKVVIPQGTYDSGQNVVLDVPGIEEEDIFVATKPRNQKPAHILRTRPSGPHRPRPDPPHTPHSLVTVGPEPDELEQREQQNLEDDLKNYHSARRKLFYDVLTLQVTKLKKGIKQHHKKD
ncbi:uncharacterized protein LOC126742090 [Anthonomus grandis grandis]|uniref:uncharacterized protein LOC126742090 n=1 Tax=Anthonomus grandis grandis TaxID=2921223 RepID=UPI0021655B6A|nr:uncharacterized protein LOC126742090 [Anthonomus grandis grandis]